MGMLEDAMGEILAPDEAETTRLGALANELVEVTQAVSKGEARKKEIKKEIIGILDRSGLDVAVADGRRLGFTTRKYYGVAEGDTPEAGAKNLERLHEWLDRVAPEVNIPASTNIGKAVNAYLDANPDAEVPDFVKVTEQRQLTNRQA